MSQDRDSVGKNVFSKTHLALPQTFNQMLYCRPLPAEGTDDLESEAGRNFQ